LIDNSALNLAIKKGLKILPVFIFHPEQIDESRNPYFSHPSVQFLCESLIELDAELKKADSSLHVFRGDTVKVLEALHASCKFQQIFSNRDFTVFARQRDARIKEWCKKNSVIYTDCEDYDIVPIHRVLMNEGTAQARPYTVLTHYLKKLIEDVNADKTLVRRPHSEPISAATFVHETVESQGFPLLSKDDLSKLYLMKSTAVQK
jgi:deoxyribodipyrimidine photo-lyase